METLMVVVGFMLAQVPLIVELLSGEGHKTDSQKVSVRAGLIMASAIVFMLIFPEATAIQFIFLLLVTISWLILVLDHALNKINNRSFFYRGLLPVFIIRLGFFVASLLFFINSINMLNS